MKAAQILSALNLFPKWEINKKYCSKLSNICSLVSELKKMPGYSFELGKIMDQNECLVSFPKIIEPAIKQEYGKDTREYKNYLERQTARANEINLIDKWLIQIITVSCNAGSYTFYIPTDNDFYNYFMGLIGANTPEQTKEYIKPVFEAILSSLVIDHIKTAIPYLSKDTLRPAFTGICLEIEGDLFRIVATDAHRLYVGQQCLCDHTANWTNSIKLSKYRFIIPVEQAKQIAAIKGPAKHEPVIFTLLSGDHSNMSNGRFWGKFEINGIKGELIDAVFPEYPNVIPLDNPYCIELERETLLSHIRQNMTFAHKFNHQLNFYLNGNVKIAGFDKDNLKNECVTQFDYVQSNVPDMSIAFNGKLLTEILKGSKSKTVKIELSTNTRGAIFKDDLSNDMALLMPLMIGK